jgi:hypothetical protein
MKHVVDDDGDVRVDGIDQLVARVRQTRALAAQSRAGAADEQKPEVAAAARQLADDLDRFADKYEPILRRPGATES